jgi:hypothetical protein
MSVRASRLWLLWIGVTASVALPVSSAQAATNVPCSTAALVAAVDAANAAGTGTLNLAPGCTYRLSSPYPNLSFGQSGLGITGDLTIRGHGATITRSLLAPAFRLIQVGNSGGGSLSVDRLTLTGGLRTEDSYGGGAIFAAPGSTVSITRSTLSGNQVAGGGGAIAASSRTAVSIDDSTLTDNVARSSGGAVNANGDLEISGSTLSRNTARTNGGAIYYYGFNSDGDPNEATVTTSTFSDNSAAQAGGGIAISHTGSATISRSTFVGNRGGGSAYTTPNVAENFGGGAIEITNFESVLVKSSTVVGNVAVGSGGGILALGGHTRVSGSTIARNVAVNGGGLAGGAAQVSATIVADNQASTAANCVGVIDRGHNLDSGASCGFSTANGSISNADPRLGPLADNGGPTETVALGAGSPAIDVIPPPAVDPFGGSMCTGTTDQRGVARPQGPACDIGAYELEP